VISFEVCYLSTDQKVLDSFCFSSNAALILPGIAWPKAVDQPDSSGFAVVLGVGECRNA